MVWCELHPQPGKLAQIPPLDYPKRRIRLLVAWTPKRKKITLSICPRPTQLQKLLLHPILVIASLLTSSHEVSTSFKSYLVTCSHSAPWTSYFSFGPGWIAAHNFWQPNILHPKTWSNNLNLAFILLLDSDIFQMSIPVSLEEYNIICFLCKRTKDSENEIWFFELAKCKLTELYISSKIRKLGIQFLMNKISICNYPVYESGRR